MGDLRAKAVADRSGIGNLVFVNPVCVPREPGKMSIYVQKMEGGNEEC